MKGRLWEVEATVVGRFCRRSFVAGDKKLGHRVSLVFSVSLLFSGFFVCNLYVVVCLGFSRVELCFKVS